jgi:alpha-beta hydrolase superfamily lysophospholipase
MLPALAILCLVVLLVLFLLGAVAWRWSTELIKSPRADEPSDPDDYGLPFTEVLFPSRDGLTLHGWFIPARGVTAFSLEGSDWPTGSKGTIVFGHGRSEGDYTSFGYHERKDLLGAIDLLQSKGILRVGVLGFSLGAVVGISTAAQCPAIAALVADGAFVTVRKALARGAEERGVPRWLVRALGPAILWLAGRRVGGDLEESDPLRRVDKIAPRALFLIHGEEDPYVSMDDVRRLYEEAGEPKELWIAPGAGHRRVDQAYPEEYRERVLSFFGRYLSGGVEEAK